MLDQSRRQWLLLALDFRRCRALCCEPCGAHVLALRLLTCERVRTFPRFPLIMMELSGRRGRCEPLLDAHEEAVKARLLRLRESSSEGRRVDALDSCMEIVDAHLVTILTFLLRAHKQLRVNALKPVVGHFRTL